MKADKTAEFFFNLSNFRFRSLIGWIQTIKLRKREFDRQEKIQQFYQLTSCLLEMQRKNEVTIVFWFFSVSNGFRFRFVGFGCKNRFRFRFSVSVAKNFESVSVSVADFRFRFSISVAKTFWIVGWRLSVSVFQPKSKSVGHCRYVISPIQIFDAKEIQLSLHFRRDLTFVIYHNLFLFDRTLTVGNGPGSLVIKSSFPVKTLPNFNSKA